VTASSAPSTAKTALRRELLARRRALLAADLARAAESLAAAVAPLASGVVALYVSAGQEPPTGPLLDALADRRVLLPVLLADGDLDWAVWEGRLVPGPRRTEHPPGTRLGREAVAACDLVVVPAVAVDRRGVRLGRGGGSYDRALPRARGLVVALLHDGELVDRLPAQPHDVPVAAAATPSRGLVRLPERMSA
jgi:5-formyltetrahydrofolate cyclo-ligase